jgi:hypothetical protein
VDSNDTPAGGPHWELPTPPPDPAAEPADGAPAKPGAVTRGKLALVAGAVGLVAAGGIGGFVLGQSSSATAGTSTDQPGSHPGFPGGEGGFRGGSMPGGPISGGVPGDPAPDGTGTGSATGSDPTT